jgi:putative flippase GtrA
MRPWAPLFRFLIVGGGLFLLDTAVFLLLFSFGMAALVANALGMLAGFICGLFAHHSVTFRLSEPLNRYMALRYGGAFLINLVVGSLILQLGLAVGLLPVLAKVLATAVVTLNNFLLYRFWVFRRSH